ncbi:MAG: hypothetical protein R2867_42550 [Caldilineaceae bacterium]
MQVRPEITCVTTAESTAESATAPKALLPTSPKINSMAKDAGNWGIKGHASGNTTAAPAATSASCNSFTRYATTRPNIEPKSNPN